MYVFVIVSLSRRNYRIDLVKIWNGDRLVALDLHIGNFYPVKFMVPRRINGKKLNSFGPHASAAIISIIFYCNL